MGFTRNPKGKLTVGSAQDARQLYIVSCRTLPQGSFPSLLSLSVGLGHAVAQNAPSQSIFLCQAFLCLSPLSGPSRWLDLLGILLLFVFWLVCLHVLWSLLACLFGCFFVSLFRCLLICLRVYLPFVLLDCVFVCVCLCVSFALFVCLFVRLFVCVACCFFASVFAC